MLIMLLHTLGESDSECQAADTTAPDTLVGTIQDTERDCHSHNRYSELWDTHVQTRKCRYYEWLWLASQVYVAGSRADSDPSESISSDGTS